MGSWKQIIFSWFFFNLFFFIKEIKNLDSSFIPHCLVGIFYWHVLFLLDHLLHIVGIAYSLIAADMLPDFIEGLPSSSEHGVILVNVNQL